jgi:hypothetical protein
MPDTEHLGWLWPGASRKAHWFGPDAKSLCGKWLLPRASDHDFTLGDEPGPDDCVGCWRRAKALQSHEDR